MNKALKLKVKWVKRDRHCITAHLLHNAPYYYVLMGIVPCNTVQHIVSEHSERSKLGSDNRSYVN